MRKIVAPLAATAGAAALVLSTAAPTMAAVAYEPGSGGFVGKGDVQEALGLNNKTFQGSSFAFSYTQNDSYDVTCEWMTGPSHKRTTHRVESLQSVSVTSAVVGDQRQKNQLLGFDLGAVSLSSAAPVQVGEACTGDDAGSSKGTFVEVAKVSSSGIFLVSSGGVTAPLANTPVA